MAKAWKKAVISEMNKLLPEYELIKRKEKGEEKGMLKFRFKAGESLWFYIIYRPLISEAFDAFVGWSKLGDSPYGDVPVFDYNESQAVNISKDYFMTCTINLAGRSGLSYWNFLSVPDEIINDEEKFALYIVEDELKLYTDETAFDFVLPSVKAGVHEVLEYGIPYLEKILKLSKGGGSAL